MHIPHLLKVVVTDLAGVGLIIASGLLGWLPGPGGIPMFLAGLGLLSIHHTWARRLLRYIQREGTRLFDRLFPDHPVIVIFYDVLVLLLVVTSVVALRYYTSRLSTAVGIMLLCFGLGFFLGNRKRLQKINRLFRHFSR